MKSWKCLVVMGVLTVLVQVSSSHTIYFTDGTVIKNCTVLDSREDSIKVRIVEQVPELSEPVRREVWFQADEILKIEYPGGAVRYLSKKTETIIGARRAIIHLGLEFPMWIPVGFRGQISPSISLGIRGALPASGLDVGAIVGAELKWYYPAGSFRSFTVGIHEDVMCVFNFWYMAGSIYSITSITIGRDLLSRSGFNFFFDVGMSFWYCVKCDPYRGKRGDLLPYVNIAIGRSY